MTSVKRIRRDKTQACVLNIYQKEIANHRRYGERTADDDKASLQTVDAISAGVSGTRNKVEYDIATRTPSECNILTVKRYGHREGWGAKASKIVRYHWSRAD